MEMVLTGLVEEAKKALHDGKVPFPPRKSHIGKRSVMHNIVVRRTHTKKHVTKNL